MTVLACLLCSQVPASEPVQLRVVQFLENPRLARFNSVTKPDLKSNNHGHQSLETVTTFYNITSPTENWLLAVDVSIVRPLVRPKVEQPAVELLTRVFAELCL